MKIILATDATQEAINPRIIGPAAEYVASVDKTFIVYQGAASDPYALAYDHSNNTLSSAVKVGTNPLTSDSHGTPAIVIDADGYLHVFYGCHDGAVKYAKSNSAHSIAAWTQQTDPSSSGTYPNAFKLSNGTLMLVYRGTGGHVGDWVFRTSTDKGVTWSGETAFLDGVSPNVSWYPGFSQQGDEIHCYPTYKDDDNSAGAAGPEWTHRYHVYFLKRTSAGTWKNAAGTTLTPPVAKATLDSSCRVRNSGTSRTNCPSGTVDADGNPCLLYQIVSGSPGTFEFARWNGTSWDVTAFGKCDHFFDMTQIDFRGGTTFHAYVIAGGTSGAYGSLDTKDNTRDRGGFLERWISTDNGATWAIDDVLVYDYRYTNPTIPKNAHDDLYLLISEWQDLDVFSGRLLGLSRTFEPRVIY